MKSDTIRTSIVFLSQFGGYNRHVMAESSLSFSHSLKCTNRASRGWQEVANYMKNVNFLSNHLFDVVNKVDRCMLAIKFLPSKTLNADRSRRLISIMH
jgi:hypothetical protein